MFVAGFASLSPRARRRRCFVMYSMDVRTSLVGAVLLLAGFEIPDLLIPCGLSACCVVRVCLSRE